MLFFKIDLWGGRWQGSSMFHTQIVAWYYTKNYGVGYCHEIACHTNSDMYISGETLSGTVLTINFNTNVSYIMARVKIMKPING